MDEVSVIGQFEVTSGALIVSDPCYKREYLEDGTDIMGRIEGVRNGIWYAEVHLDCGTVTELVATAEETFPKEWWWRREKFFEVGVDSGQAGIFDDSVYPQVDIVKYGDPDNFYGRCCEQTVDVAGVVPGGVVSRSGHGDGCYLCFTARNEAGECIGVKIVFMTDEDTDDEDEHTWAWDHEDDEGGDE